MDYYLRLDRYLGKFFDYLDKKVGRDNYVIALSGDHGVLPIPEELERRGFPSKRYPPKELNKRIKQTFAAISQEFGASESFFKKKIGDGILLDYDLAKEYGINPEELDRVVVEHLRNVDPIVEVYTARDLQKSGGDERSYINRYRHSYYKKRSADIFIRFKPYYLLSSGLGSSHGSPYEYDTHVPLIFMGAAIQPGFYDQEDRTVDLAPTLAEILGISPDNEIDGQSSASLMRKK
jgi:arylsulfatase A-like enzyme